MPDRVHMCCKTGRYVCMSVFMCACVCVCVCVVNRVCMFDQRTVHVWAIGCVCIVKSVCVCVWYNEVRMHSRYGVYVW